MNKDSRIYYKIIFLIVFMFGMGRIYYQNYILPDNYKKNFIKNIRKNTIKEVYFYNYTILDTRQIPRNKNNLETLKWLKRIKPNNRNSFCFNCDIYKIINKKRLRIAKKFKKIINYLNDFSVVNKGEYLNNGFLLQIIFENNQIIWINIGVGKIGKHRTTSFLIYFPTLKANIKYKKNTYLFFKLESYKRFRAPELEKFFEQFHLEKRREENRKKLKNGDN